MIDDCMISYMQFFCGDLTKSVDLLGYRTKCIDDHITEATEKKLSLKWSLWDLAWMLDLFDTLS